MSIALNEALQDVDLEVGRTYHCQVGKLQVELRVLPESRPMDITNDTMLDPWVNLPYPGPSRPAKGTKIPRPLPDVPVIPTNEARE